MVYHIINPEYPNSLEHGYIGVTNSKRGVRRRFVGHKNSSRHMHTIIRINKINFDDHVKILCYADMLYCYELEHKLRPYENIGWNLAAGGVGYNWDESASAVSKFRSMFQSERMKDEELKKKQGESFKENYYSDEESQQLRKKRSIEHMADPIKKQKCLNAIHKMKKCPHCEFENNVGNVALHIKRKHKEIQ